MKSRAICSLVFALVSVCGAVFDTVWTTRVHFPGYNAYGSHCRESGDGGYVMTGYALSSDNSGIEVHKGFLLKTDANGRVLWKRLYPDTVLMWGTSIVKAENSGYSITGLRGKSGASPIASLDGVVMTTDPDGVVDKHLVFDRGGWESVNFAIEAHDGGIVAVGLFASGDLNINAWLFKTDLEGVLKWSTVVGNTDMDVCFDIAHTRENGYIATGYTQSDDFQGLFRAWLLKLDANGNLEWEKTFSGSGISSIECAYSVKQTDDGYVIAGYVHKNSRDVLLMRTDSLGTVKWVKHYGGENDEEANSLELLSDGGFMISGNSFDQSRMDRDIWVLRTNSSGDTLWTRRFGGPYIDGAEKITKGSDGSFLIAGTTRISESGEAHAWLLKLSSGATPLRFAAEDMYGGAVAAPRSSLLVQTGNTTVRNGIVLYDVNGRIRSTFRSPIRPDRSGGNGVFIVR